MRTLVLDVAAVAILIFVGAVWSTSSLGQQGTTQPLVIKATALPKGYLRRPYRFEMHADGGITPLKWQATNGSLPAGVVLGADGVLSGIPTQTGDFSFAVVVTDSDIPAHRATQEFTLLVVTPMLVRWSRVPKVNGTRVDGSIKVSNQTGEDFDLTMIVLAVNENGRATAIGYQHFALKQNTIDFEIPFGENLPYGTYSINVDVVGEVAASNSIYRSRLATNVTIVQPT